MADVIFYATGEIFWVSDPPHPFGKPHIGVPNILPSVPPDHFFTYALAAHTLEKAGHNIIGAFGRQRRVVRDAFNSDKFDFQGDPEILALDKLSNSERTVLVLILTDTGTPAQGGVDEYVRIKFTESEAKSLNVFRQRGGGLYVTWDHGQLGYEAMRELGLEGPVDPEPLEPQRPNVQWSNDSTDEAKVAIRGFIKRPDGTLEERNDIMVSVGPPAGYLQKIVPAQVIGNNPQPPHPIFNGVGGIDGIWIPAHMHEGKLKIDASLRRIDESRLPPGVKTLAVHVPFTETSFNSFAVFAYKDDTWQVGDHDNNERVDGRVIWSTSFHHLVDINWVSDGKVPWDPYVPFSAQALWRQQLPPELFDERLERGMKRLWVNMVKWLAHELPGSPVEQQLQNLYKSSSLNAASSMANQEQELLSRIQKYTVKEKEPIRPADLNH